MLGETIRVYPPTQRLNELGEAIDGDDSYTVDNVVIRPKTPMDNIDMLHQQGAFVRFVIALPKGFHGNLRACKVELVSRGDTTRYDVIGQPEKTVPCPTAWDTICELGVYDG